MTAPITLPRGCRNRFYFVIIMPLNVDGHGPASEERGEVRKITWEVWDQEMTSHGSYDYLPDAIDEAERLNEEYHMTNTGVVE